MRNFAPNSELDSFIFPINNLEKLLTRVSVPDNDPKILPIASQFILEKIE